jgi:DNA-binding protein HU-beta
MSNKESGMSRKQIVQALARKSGLTKRSTAEMLAHLESLITSEITAGRSITLTGFGTFFVAPRKARRGINPNTKESLDIPGMLVPRFRAGSSLKAAVRKQEKE